MTIVLPPSDPLVVTLTGLLPPSAPVAALRGDAELPLRGVERHAVDGAVPKRRAEFSRGRACARAALRNLGLADVAIGVGDDRRPLWPTGIVGSITHCEGLAVAVVGRGAAFAGLGIDAEPARALPSETRHLILGGSERGDDIIETVIFSAKEAIHKALFPGTKVWMDFLDVVLTIDRENHSFRAAATGRAPVAPGLTDIRGRYAVDHGFVLTACSLASQGR